MTSIISLGLFIYDDGDTQLCLNTTAEVMFIVVQNFYSACWKENTQHDTAEPVHQHYQYNVYWLHASNQQDLL